MNRKLMLALALLSLLVAGVTEGVTPVVHAATVQKRVCRTVTKKVHGKKKKVRVCTAVAAKPKPTATDTPRPTNTPTPQPTATSLRTNTPQPTSTPQPRFQRTQHGIIDTFTGVSASVVKLLYGSTNNYTLNPNPGAAFQWVLGTETNTGNQSFVSSYFDFELQNKATGQVYELKNGTPYGATESIMPVLRLSAGQTSAGWMEGSVPNTPATYYVMWNEDNAIPWVA